MHLNPACEVVFYYESHRTTRTNHVNPSTGPYMGWAIEYMTPLLQSTAFNNQLQQQHSVHIGYHRKSFTIYTTPNSIFSAPRVMNAKNSGEKSSKKGEGWRTNGRTNGPTQPKANRDRAILDQSMPMPPPEGIQRIHWRDQMWLQQSY